VELFCPTEYNNQPHQLFECWHIAGTFACHKSDIKLLLMNWMENVTAEIQSKTWFAGQSGGWEQILWFAIFLFRTSYGINFIL